MGIFCRCCKKKEIIRLTESIEILKLNDNSLSSKKILSRASKFNINSSSFINQKHIKDFIEDYEEIDLLGKGYLIE